MGISGTTFVKTHPPNPPKKFFHFDCFWKKKFLWADTLVLYLSWSHSDLITVHSSPNVDATEI